MATSTNAENVIKTESTNVSDNGEGSLTNLETSERTITINDPVKVTITVVQGTDEDKSQVQTSNANDLSNLGKTETSSSAQSITINDPKQVTITVVQATAADKTSGKTDELSSSITEITTTVTTTTTGEINDLTNVEKLETSTSEQSSEVSDPVTISSTSEKSTSEDKTVEQAPTSTAIVEEPDENAEKKNETETTTTTTTTIEDVTESTPALNSAAPATEENKTVEETTATTDTSVQEKKESESNLGSTASPAEADQTIQETTTTTEDKKEETTTTTPPDTTTEEKKESASESTSSVPASEDTTKLGEATAVSSSSEEKKEEAPQSTTSAPAAPEDQKSEEITTTTVTSTEEKTESEPALASSTPAPEENKKTEETTTTVTSTEEKKESEPALASSIPAPEENKKAEETTTTVTSTEEKKESEPALASSTPATEENKKAEETETTTTTTTTVTSESSADDNTKKEDSAPSLAGSASNKDEVKQNAVDFPIVKDSSKALTDFQRKKAEYFFNINLDIENKKFITWEDVEFYLLFHVTAAGKEGADGGNLEGRLSRAARALWEHIHDQVPSSDGNRDKVTLEQFLDTWASLVDYIIKNGKLPDLIQDLVNVGFELYSTTDGDNKTPTIPPSAFEHLFQKMTLGRPFALMAYKFLTENGTKPLDADKVNTIVRAVITSSDDEHNSHFLLPGFFKTITNKPNEKDATNQPQPPAQDSNDKKTPTPAPTPSTPTPAQPTQPAGSSAQPQAASVQQQPGQPQAPTGQQQPGQPQKPGGPSSQPQTPSSPQQRGGPSSQPPASRGPQQASIPASNQQQLASLSPQQQKAFIKQQDDNIRRLLSYYRIDDNDIVEVDDGPVHRLLLVHPERPLPPYIQQNKALIQELQNPTLNAPPFCQVNGLNAISSRSDADQKSPPEETKSKVTLEERISRGEAQTGPTVPASYYQQDNKPLTDVRQVYPPLNAAQQQEQKRQAQLQANPPVQSSQPSVSPSTNQEEKKETEEKKQTEEKQTSEEIVSTSVSASKQDETPEKKEITKEDEEQIVASVLKQMTPIVEQMVAAEIRRVRNGQEDDNDFVPFPFMFGGGPVFAGPRDGTGPQGFQQQDGNFGGGPGGPSFLPPELLMSMMTDLARGGVAGDVPNYSGNGPPPRGAAAGASGIGGFMMFVDENQGPGGQPYNLPPRPGPRY